MNAIYHFVPKLGLLAAEFPMLDQGMQALHDGNIATASQAPFPYRAPSQGGALFEWSYLATHKCDPSKYWVPLPVSDIEQDHWPLKVWKLRTGFRRRVCTSEFYWVWLHIYLFAPLRGIMHYAAKCCLTPFVCTALHKVHMSPLPWILSESLGRGYLGPKHRMPSRYSVSAKRSSESPRWGLPVTLGISSRLCTAYADAMRRWSSLGLNFILD